MITKYYGGSIVNLALHCGDNHIPALKMRRFIMAIIIFSHRRRARGLSLQKVRFLKIKDMMICVSQNCRFCGGTEKSKLNRELCFAVPWINRLFSFVLFYLIIQRKLFILLLLLLLVQVLIQLFCESIPSSRKITFYTCKF